MNSISTVLAGWQQSFVPAVEAYWIENPVPLNQIARIAPSGWITTTDGQHLNPLHYTPEQPPPKRRYSKKGEASGSIKERIGNKKRKRPSTSYFYEWYDDGRKQQRYVQTALMSEVSQMIDQRRPSAEIIQFLNQRSKRKP
ncbi:hypothetical protein [Stenomitos frigidus]|uniref:Uncharacterized protein n=1 Tax=Stenomitos frigidus ULC18 TaxID=2107698 RepID=A0A2T1EAZ5_9CYAN|nr:hypothetical protein [Stenomitos frigidus]PSB29929.1 hypothetical protein C7B82_10275 [Stenomitos frigidus ULC18]